MLVMVSRDCLFLATVIFWLLATDIYWLFLVYNIFVCIATISLVKYQFLNTSNYSIVILIRWKTRSNAIFEKQLTQSTVFTKKNLVIKEKHIKLNLSIFPKIR